jgi:hypothetical protein
MDLLGRSEAAAQAVLDEAKAEGIPLTRGGAYRLTYAALACDDANHAGAVEALRLIADPPMGDDYTAPREYAEWLRDQARRALANLGGQ